MRHAAMTRLAVSVGAIVLANGLAAEANVPTAFPTLDSPVPLTDWLVLPGTSETKRRPFAANSVTRQIVEGSWSAPTEGMSVRGPDGEAVTWAKAKAGENGSLEHDALHGGWAWTKYESPRLQRALLWVKGPSVAYVNGQIRAGDPYRFGYVYLPVMLKEGANEFLFQCSRGTLEAKLLPAAGDLLLNLRDTTLPEALIGQDDPLWAGIVVLNTTDQPRPVQVAVAVAVDPTGNPVKANTANADDPQPPKAAVAILADGMQGDICVGPPVAGQVAGATARPENRRQRLALPAVGA